jgi:hypothetical protein
MSHRKREAIIVLLSLAKSFHLACNRSLAYYCAERSLEISPDSGISVRAESMATAALCSSILGDTARFESFMQQARDLAGKQLDVLKTIEQYTAIAKAGAGKWRAREK